MSVNRGALVAALFCIAVSACGGEAGTSEESEPSQGGTTAAEQAPTAEEEQSSTTEAEPGATQAEAPATADPAVEGAARAEGAVVFYCAIDELTCDGLGTAFSEQYPEIEVQTIRLVSAQLGARYAAEREANAPTADVLMTSDAPFVAAGVEDGILGGWGDLLPADYPEDFITSDSGNPFTFAINGTAYNTELVDPADVPTTYEDLLDPMWTDAMCAASPVVSPSVAVMYGTIRDSIGPNYLTQLAAQNIEFYADGNAAATAALAAGECSIQALANAGHITDVGSEGAPVEITFLPGVTGAPFVYALNSEPAHPNAQTLFAQWLISEEGNQTLVEFVPSTGSALAEGSVPDAVPPNFDYFSDESQQEVLAELEVEL